MAFLVTLFFITVHSIDYRIFTYRINAVKIDTRMDNFSVTAYDVPESAFLISSFSTPSSIRIEYNEWVRNYNFYSIEGFMNQIPSIEFISINYYSTLSVTICSFTELISNNASIEINYNIPPTPQQPCSFPWIGSNCSILSTLITPGSSESFSIPPFTSKFFNTDLLQSSQSIKILVSSGNLHSFFNYNSNFSSTNIANFLSPDNYLETSSNNIAFPANPDSITDSFVSFSVFCLDYSACNFTVKLNDSDINEDNSKQYTTIIIVLSIGLCLFLVALVVFCARFCRNSFKNCGKKDIQLAIEKYFPSWEVGEEFRDKECSICFENFRENFSARKSVCGHFFHALCIEEWAENNLSCPLCRSQVVSNS